ncbi:ketopantoate reductase family protein [Alkalilimnicola ehrlichii]|uniref:ketopantoate reductase family protein n=1 Tax=Alkalilimnicola ehrlichii TaxID=351052 RepID=UPI001C6F1701|nr:ketopantoate reductase C-terminal domain-containing protein [Alkalilimnicola ehrlichii]
MTAEVVTERWRKAVWNAAFNPLSVLAGGADTQTMLHAEGGERFLRHVMEEVCAVAAAAGHPLPAELPEKSLAGTHRMPAYKNSMALDYLNGRPMELEAILGNVVREAERYNVEVPRLETVYRAMKC